MKIESGQFKKILRHTCDYDGNYRNKVFTNLNENDLKFVRSQLSKNVASEDNRFEDYVVTFSGEDLDNLFCCFESISKDNVINPMKKKYIKDIIAHEFLATKIFENILNKARLFGLDQRYIEFQAGQILKLNKAFASGNYKNLDSQNLGFEYPTYSDVMYFAEHAKNMVVLNFDVSNLEFGVESDTILQESVNDYMSRTKHTVSRIYTDKDYLITSQNLSGNYIQPVHDYDLVTGIEYNPSM